MEPTSYPQESTKERNINTNTSEHNDLTATHVLPVDTNGTKSRQDEVLERLLIKQPLYDKFGHACAVELILRIRLAADSDEKNAVTLRQSDDTTLVAGLFSLTEDGKHPAHPLLINISSATFLSEDIDFLPQQHVILALDINAKLSAAVLSRIKQLQKSGYQILLDYQYGAAIPSAFKGIFKRARLDVGLLNATELENAAITLNQHGIHHLIAANIRCQESMDLCNKLKFTQFQGSYFEPCSLLTDRPTEISRLRLLELMDSVIARQDLTEIDNLIKYDARLSYQLIGYVNTVDSNTAPVNSTLQAIQLLKHEGLYRWLTLLLHTSMDNTSSTRIKLKRGLNRAFFLEAMANKSLQHTNPQAMYLMGLLSVMDSLTDHTMAQLIPPLKLSPEVKLALTEYKDIYGLMLKLTLAAENGEQANIENYAARCLINPIEVNLAMINAMVMADTINL